MRDLPPETGNVQSTNCSQDYLLSHSLLGPVCQLTIRLSRHIVLYHITKLLSSFRQIVQFRSRENVHGGYLSREVSKQRYSGLLGILLPLILLYVVKQPQQINFLRCITVTAFNTSGKLETLCNDNSSVGTIHRCIDASRYLSRDSYRDTVCKYRNTFKKKLFLVFVVQTLLYQKLRQHTGNCFPCLSLLWTWDKLNWPLKRSHFPTHNQSAVAVQGPDSIHSSQHFYGLITRQTVFNFLQCYMLCGTAFVSDREGGAESLWNSFFSNQATVSDQHILHLLW